GARFVLDDRLYDASVLATPDGADVIGQSGLYQIAGGEIVRHFPRDSHEFHSGLLAEGTRALWGTYGTDDDMVKIVDIEGELGVKVLAGFAGPLPVVGAVPPRVVVYKKRYDEETEGPLDERDSVQIHDPSGAMVGRLDLRWHPEAAV